MFLKIENDKRQRCEHQGEDTLTDVTQEFEEKEVEICGCWWEWLGGGVDQGLRQGVKVLREGSGQGRVLSRRREKLTYRLVFLGGGGTAGCQRRLRVGEGGGYEVGVCVQGEGANNKSWSTTPWKVMEKACFRCWMSMRDWKVSSSAASRAALAHSFIGQSFAHRDYRRIVHLWIAIRSTNASCAAAAQRFSRCRRLPSCN